MIDDEADYASINTKDEDEDPTNKQIYKYLFHKSTYIGYTSFMISKDEMQKMIVKQLYGSKSLFCNEDMLPYPKIISESLKDD